MTERLRVIVDLLPKCKIFADIGCDHGYLSQSMLRLNKCEKVMFSDISAKCLSKATALLQEYIENGKAKGYVSDGFVKGERFDLALIAGMGGVEICSILDNAEFLPERLALQPMKNVSLVREKVVSLGYKILTDKKFKASNKFYDIIVTEKGEDRLTAEELEFGRTNLLERGAHFTEWVNVTVKKLQKYSEREDISPNSKVQLLDEIGRLKNYV